MAEENSNLPLHDEAKARSKWRDGETILDEGGDGASGPASEMDQAAQGHSGSDDASPLSDLIKRPPD